MPQLKLGTGTAMWLVTEPNSEKVNAQCEDYSVISYGTISLYNNMNIKKPISLKLYIVLQTSFSSSLMLWPNKPECLAVQIIFSLA